MCDVGLRGGRSFMDSYEPAWMTSSIPVTKTSDPTHQKGSRNTAELSNLTRCPTEHSPPSPALAINIQGKDRSQWRAGVSAERSRRFMQTSWSVFGTQKNLFFLVTAKVAERCRIACLPKVLLSCSALTPPHPTPPPSTSPPQLLPSIPGSSKTLFSPQLRHYNKLVWALAVTGTRFSTT